MMIFINEHSFVLRLAQMSDAKPYYDDCFCPLDKTVATMTGSKSIFTKQEVIKFFENALNDKTYCWLLLCHNQKIIGECVFMDMEHQQAHFRMAIFSQNYRNIGLGKQTLIASLAYAFNELMLKQVELEVYEFNQVAYQLYKQVGFKTIQYLADDIFYENKWYGKWIMVLKHADYCHIN